ncbi:unnamed protein product [Blepharisma stoltei]|uniref:Peptidase A1 domain-containing protein n=1 Tax=Blepharisma stoltei TaxID=1481888 RepID=A0AAU9J9X6_9CILI|nr:unnamed protein product [Blepharisma stoltei]
MKFIIFLLAFTLILAYQNSLSPSSYQIPLKRISLNKQEKQALISLVSKSQTSPITLSDTPSNNFLSLKSHSKSKIKLKNFANTQFVGSVGIGNPPQFLDVIFDTGSANFWVNSKLCKDPPCLQHDAYDHTKSSDYETYGPQVEVTFGTGSIEGIINYDTVTFAGLTLHHQTFGEITDEEGEVFDDGKFCGLLGLAFPSLAAEGTLPVFDNVIKSGLLENNIFAFYYSLDPDETSELMVGDVNEKKFKGEINWVPIMEGFEYYWLIEIEDIRLGEKSLGLCEKKPCRGAVDTGTSLLAAPFEHLFAVYENLDSDCTSYEKYPDFVFVIKGKEYRIKSKDYVITMNDDGEDNPGMHSDDFSECTLAIMGLDVPEPSGPLWVLGDIFLSSYYSVYDRDNNRVGLAEAVHK